MRPLSQDFSSLLATFAEYPSSQYLKMSRSSKEALGTFFLSLILNCLRNREIRRTYNLLTKGQGAQVLRLLSPDLHQVNPNQTLNPEVDVSTDSAKVNTLDFETFMTQVKAKSGSLRDLEHKEIEYLRKRFARGNAREEVVSCAELEETLQRWLWNIHI